MKEHPYLTFGPANDEVGLAALGLGLVLLVFALVRGKALVAAFERVPAMWCIGALALAAALLSWLYLAHFLHGGPRIIDACAYFLEGRALSAGHFSFAVPEPSGSFRGRFLLTAPDGKLGVIFPPGYPLLLALGFLVRAPLAVGPLLAAALVVATYGSTKALLGDERVARLAALVSMLCAALRYHTADTMSHGLSALLFTVAMGCAALETKRSSVLAGLAAGWLVATRPVSGAALVVVAMFVLRRKRLLIPVFVAGLVPGLALFALHAHASTGSWFGSTQLAYYALSDGPPGCFRYGFGAGIGCRFEHGDFVKQALPSGFGFVEATLVTIDRLALHGIDVANFVPLALAVPWAAVRYRTERNVSALALSPVAIVLAYLPFYYPASYPGGGARLFAEVLPLEQALVALALVRLRLERFAPAAMLLGFGLHAVHQHAALGEREGGSPMFTTEGLGGVTSGLVFVGTDHGFLLGHDPSSQDAARGLVVARRRDDAHDRVLWERLGRPRSYRYDYDVDRGTTTLVPFVPSPPALRYEAEAEWPPLAVRGGWAHPDYRACLSRGQGLHLRATTSPSSRVELANVSLELVPPSRGRYDLSIGWLADPSSTLRVSVAGISAEFESRASGERQAPPCDVARVGSLDLEERAVVTISAPADLVLDYFELTPVDAKKR